ncbi:MAG: tetratricopeptide repeat protein [Thermodesulfobacteriota bacterium]
MNQDGRQLSRASIYLAAALIALISQALCGLPSIAWAEPKDIRPSVGAPIDALLSGGRAARLANADTSQGAKPQVAPKPTPSQEQKDRNAKPQLVAPQAPETSVTDASQTTGGPSPDKPAPQPEPKQPDPGDAGDALKSARALFQKEEYAPSLEAFRAALKKSEKAGDQKTAALALYGMAQAFNKLGQDDEALKSLQRSIQLNQVLKNAKARSLDYLLMGRILMGQNRFQPALEAFQEALKILPESEDAERPRLHEDMATCQLRLNHFAEAVGEYNRLIAFYVKKGNEKEAARIHVLTGNMKVSRSDYQNAKASFQKAEALYRKLNQRKELGETLFRLAYVNQLNGDLKAAQKEVKEGQSFLSGQTESDFDALPLLVNGQVAFNRGDMVAAFKSVSAALNSYNQAGDRIMAARALLALARIEEARARFSAALRLAGTALNDFRALSDPSGECAAILLVGEVYFQQGYAQKALEYAQESLALAKKINDATQMTESRILLADIHSIMGDVDFAWKLLKEAAQDSSATVNRRTKARVRLAVARFRLARDASDPVLKTAEAARKLFEETDDTRGMADCDLVIGQVLEQRGEREKGLAMFEQALQAYRTTWDRLGEGKVLTAIGVHHKNAGDYEQALKYFGEAQDLLQGIQDRRGYAANLANIGNILKHKNSIPESVRNLEQALQVYRELSDKKGEADILTNLGNVLAARGSQAEALDKLSTALARHREIQDLRGVATDLASIGRVHLGKGELQTAASSLEEAWKVNRRISNPRGDVAILSELAMLERAKRNSAKAMELLKKALKLSQEIDDSRSVSAVRLKMATVLQEAGQYDQALSLLVQTLEIMKAQGDRKGELWALGELGITQAKMGDYESALTHLRRATELRTELGLPASLARDLDFHLGEIYEGFKDYEQALEHYQKSLSMAQVAGTNSTLGRVYHRIGSVYYQLEEYAKAQESFEDALRVHSEIRNAHMQQSELIQLGDILSKLGDPEQALKRQMEALAITKKTGDAREETRVLTRVGTLNQMLGRPRVALEYYKEAKEKRAKIKDKRGVNENLLQIALVTSTLGSFEEAVEHLKEALEISQCAEDRGMLWKAYFIMGRALQSKKRYGEALESYRKAITILESTEADIAEESDEDNFIFGGKRALFETTLKVLMQLARKDPEGAYDNQALRIAERLKAASFENTLSRINVESFSDLPHELLIREKSLRLTLRTLDSKLVTELSASNPDQGQINKLLEERRAKEKAFRELKDRLNKEFPAYAGLRYPRPVSVQQLQKETIDPHEAVIAFMVTRSNTYIFAMDKTRFHTFSIDYSEKDLERDVSTLIKPLHRSDTQANWDVSVAYRLYDRLIRPVEYFLATKKTVTVIPHGPLVSLPFEMLVSSKEHAGKRFWSPTDQPSYLVEKYAFCYAPSASVLSWLRTRQRGREPGWSLVAFGDAVYQDAEHKKELNTGADRLLAAFNTKSETVRSSNLRPLPGARKEISEIARLMGGPVQVYLGAEATESLFKKADLGRYRYVHLATHGVLLSGLSKLWQQPAIVFSLYGDKDNDGFLQLGEVFGLKLNADLVVLSSCLSPTDQEAVINNGLEGLARAFLFAGADSVILSMWQANDESTANLFIEMYKGLKDGSKADGLRQAKLKLLKDKATSHPYYWAPFVLVGKWQVTVPPRPEEVDPSNLRFQGLSTWRKLLSR